ncbi:hypothetical protein PIB30_013037 [Stylosanthes scabra]|uniref:FAR1 domain-containing protein n=1 Tax=Stylosanthes scabra TaxID=79078 RepID=A0ABU6S5U5_9FABA|nr:hypothetical protein [Stylosanthes scabra]
MVFEIHQNLEPSSQDNQLFEALDELGNASGCSDSSNSTREHGLTTKVMIHNLIPDEEIPKEGMLFDTLEEARQLYYNYGNKMDFVPHIRNTNFDKDGKTPISQNIHCNRGGYRKKKSGNPKIKNSIICKLQSSHICEA